MSIQEIVNNLSRSFNPNSASQMNASNTQGQPAAAASSDPVDTVSLSTTFRDMTDRAALSAEPGTKGRESGNSVDGLESGTGQSATDGATGNLINTKAADSTRANPGPVEQTQTQEKSATGGGTATQLVQNANLLMMNPDVFLPVLQQNQTFASPEKSMGTKVNMIV